jgi:hypothetical protein
MIVLDNIVIMETLCVIFTTILYRFPIREGIESSFFSHCSLYQLMLDFFLMNMYQI